MSNRAVPMAISIFLPQFLGAPAGLQRKALRILLSLGVSVLIMRSLANVSEETLLASAFHFSSICFCVASSHVDGSSNCAAGMPTLSGVLGKRLEARIILCRLGKLVAGEVLWHTEGLAKCGDAFGVVVILRPDDGAPGFIRPYTASKFVAREELGRRVPALAST
ncbi:MAG: hypothetical protein U1F35_05355 [Steroidobacteraceae bacterium]